ncbi:hypothetical protein ABIE44_001588 [Marmoricola sp. OAE513]
MLLRALQRPLRRPVRRVLPAHPLRVRPLALLPAPRLVLPVRRRWFHPWS